MVWGKTLKQDVELFGPKSPFRAGPSVLLKCRLFLNLGVLYYPFGTPVGAQVVRQQDVQRGGAQSHERVRRSLYNKAHHSCLPKLWGTVWCKTLKNQFSFSAQKNPYQIFENFSSFSFHFLSSCISSIQLVVVLQVVLSFFMSLLCFCKLVEIVLPPSFWSAHRSFCRESSIKSRVPVENSSIPSFLR